MLNLMKLFNALSSSVERCGELLTLKVAIERSGMGSRSFEGSKKLFKLNRENENILLNLNLRKIVN